MLLILSSYNYAHIQANERMKALFIYNFLKYIDWPADKKSGNLVIGVKDDDALYAELLAISKIKKSVGSQNIVVKNVSECEAELSLLFVGKSNKSNLNQIANDAKINHVLVVTDLENGILKGLGIELIISGSQAEFDISKRNIKDCKLHISDQLLDMARNIE